MISSDEIRELYETTENDYNLRVQLAVKKGKSRTDLLASLRKSAKAASKLLNGLTDNKSVVDITAKMNKNLIKSSERGFVRTKARVTRLARTVPLVEAIERETRQGIKAGLKVKVNGRNYGYKEYMEMKVRTTIQNEIGEKQLEAGKAAGVIFYICNAFSDAADDHSAWQGKIYYDKDVGRSNEVREFIKKKKLKSVQWVRGKPVWLTTRPNCRHFLTSISVQQAMGVEPKNLLAALKLTSGKHKDKNYDLTQKQRYNERQIRKYKTRLESNEKLGNDIAQDKLLVRKWQSQQRGLIKKNPQLERDYRKESSSVILTDLGAKYRKRKK